MRKTKIVCTIGPASEELSVLKRLMEAGMNVARLNFSHGSHEEHARRIRADPPGGGGDGQNGGHFAGHQGTGNPHRRPAGKGKWN